MSRIIILIFLFFSANLKSEFKIETNSFDTCPVINSCNTPNNLIEGLFTKFGQLIPRKFTCDGIDISPKLSWSEIPMGTKSFVLIVDDPDAQHVVGFTFIHWFVMNIPFDTNKLAENESFSNPKFRNTVQLTNDFGVAKYSGPCPPIGDVVHHYRFTIYALNIASINLTQALTSEEFQAAFANNIVGCARLIGLYQR